MVIWGRRQEKNEAAAGQLAAEFGVKALPQAVDVSDEARVIEAMAEAVVEMGRVDGVIANAGVMQPVKSFLEMTGEAYHRLLAINQHGAFYAAREAARHMKARWDEGDTSGGSILFCASLSALTGSPGMQHYNAAKGAIASMARGIAVDMGKYGVRCNTVCPGYTVSETVIDQGPDSPLGKRVREGTPIRALRHAGGLRRRRRLLHERRLALPHRRSGQGRRRLDGQRREVEHPGGPRMSAVTILRPTRSRPRCSRSTPSRTQCCPTTSAARWRPRRPSRWTCPGRGTRGGPGAHRPCRLRSAGFRGPARPAPRARSKPTPNVWRRYKASFVEQCVGAAANRLRNQDFLKAHPQVQDQPIDRPIIIVGLPRSGSTHLENLIGADRRLRHLPVWLGYQATPQPGEAPGPDGRDPRVAYARSSAGSGCARTR